MRWGALVFSFFQLYGVKVSAQEGAPIYDPLNPNREIQPIEEEYLEESSMEELTIVSEEAPEVEQEVEKEPQKNEIEKTEKRPRHQKKLILNDELFETVPFEDGPNGNGNGGDESSFYLELINEFTGSVIYGRKNA